MPETQSAIGVQFESALPVGSNRAASRFGPRRLRRSARERCPQDLTLLGGCRLNVWACKFGLFFAGAPRVQVRLIWGLGSSFLLWILTVWRLFSVRSNHGTGRNEARGCPRTLRRTPLPMCLPWNAPLARIRIPRRIPHVHAGQEIRVGTCHRSWRIRQAHSAVLSLVDGIFGDYISSLGGIWGTQFPRMTISLHFSVALFNRRSFRPPLPTRRRGYGSCMGWGLGFGSSGGFLVP